MKNTKAVLSPAVRALCRNVVNATPADDVGFSEASEIVSETWGQFEDAGAVVADLEHITGFIRWMKFEGFCQTNQLK